MLVGETSVTEYICTADMRLKAVIEVYLQVSVFKSMCSFVFFKRHQKDLKRLIMDEKRIKMIAMHWLRPKEYEADILDLISMFYPKGMWLLERGIPYSVSLLVGIYSTKLKCEQVRDEYVKTELAKGLDADWYNKQYRDPLIISDMHIRHRPELQFASGDTIYIMGKLSSSSMCGSSRRYKQFLSKQQFIEKYEKVLAENSNNTSLMWFQGNYIDYIIVDVDADAQYKNESHKTHLKLEDLK